MSQQHIDLSNSTLQQHAEAYIAQCWGVRFETLLAPISTTAPCGQRARSSPSYVALQEARRQDDASLPLGAWEHELKRADWGEVSRLIVHALQHESKDMQLLAWLQEAQIRQHGIAGISATLVLIRALCLSYWDELHPNVADGDVEHRANIISSIVEKNLPAIRLAPLIGLEREHPYSWADWEQAQRNEQIKSRSGQGNVELEGATQQELHSALSGSATAGFVELRMHLQAGLQAIVELSAVLDPLFGEQAPSMSNMTQLLQQMGVLVEGELHKRGVRAPLPEDAQANSDAAPAISHAAATGTTYAASGAIRDRAEAYARLAETAEFLMRLEPHSPVPYLVRRATEWGSLNTVELYQELFLRLNGQLNIFEMLGLETSKAETS